MDDLVTWLRAQLDDDEGMARRIADAEYFHGVSSDAEAEVLALADPGRVLAEVDAKRRILDLVASTELDPLDESDRAHRTDLDAVVRLLALPYAGRDGYRDEWKP